MTRSVIQLGGQALKLDADGDSTIQASSDDTIVIKSNNTTAMTIDSSGRVLRANIIHLMFLVMTHGKTMAVLMSFILEQQTKQ